MVDRLEEQRNQFNPDSLIAIPDTEKEMIRSFYHDVIYQFGGGLEKIKEMKESLEFIVVGHLVPTLPFYLEALDKIGTITCVVAKGSTPDPSIKQWVTTTKIAKEILDKYTLECEGFQGNAREYLSTSGVKYLKNKTDSNKKTIIIDIGGYFSETLGQIMKNPAASVNNLLGIVEDTENGYRKYSTVIEENEGKSNPLKLPLISVARSQIKDSEDYNVGKAITDATDHILRVSNYTHIAESKTILIIGYGKIGMAAARVAAEKTRSPVLVCEINPVRTLKASAHSFKVVNIQEGLKQADVVICCTGQNCIKEEHIKLLKHNVYFASCTSRDDEFDESFINKLGKPKVDLGDKPEGNISDKMHIYSYIVSGKIINLLNDGNSVNFVEKAVHGYFIHGVLASLAVSAIKIYQNRENKEFFGIKDFNDLKHDLPQNSSYDNSCQGKISEILMGHKLRVAPILSNFEFKYKRYLPRDNELADLKKYLKDGSIVNISGGKKYGKTQILEMFYAINSSQYDIVWKLEGSVLLEKQFEKFAHAINNKIEEGFFSNTEKLDLSDGGLFVGKVLEFFRFYNYPYLLIYEDISLLNQTKLYSAIPIHTETKKEHVIITSSAPLGDKVFNIKIEHIRLEKFSNKEIFEYVIDDNLFWDKYKEKLLDICSKWSFEASGDETLEHEKIIGAINIAGEWLKRNKKHPDIVKIIDETLEYDNKDESINYFMETILGTLQPSTKQLLSVFYLIDMGKNKFFVTCEAIRKIGNIVFGKHILKDSIDELKDYGFIEESGDVFVAKYPQKISSSLDSSLFSNASSILINSIIKALLLYKKTYVCNDIVIEMAELIYEEREAKQDEFHQFLDSLKKTQQKIYFYFKLFCCLGKYHELNKNNFKAIKLYKQALKELTYIQDNNLSSNFDSKYKIARLNDKVGTLFFYCGGKRNNKDAIQYFEKALSDFDNYDFCINKFKVDIYKNHLMRKLIIPYSQCEHYPEENRYDELIKKYSEIVLKFSQENKLPSLEVMCYTDLGVFNKIRQNLTESNEKYQQAEKIYKKHPSLKNNSTYAVFLTNYGILHKNLGYYEKALALANNSLELKERLYGKVDTRCSTSLNEIGIYFERLGQYSDAEFNLQKAKKIRETLEKSTKTEELINITNACLARLYTSQAKIESDECKKERLIQLAHDILKNLSKIKFLNKDSDYGIFAYKYLGELYNVKNDYKNAIDVFSECIKYYMKAGKKDNLRDLLEVLILKGQVLLNLGQCELGDRSKDKELQSLISIIKAKVNFFKPDKDLCKYELANLCVFLVKSGTYDNDIRKKSKLIDNAKKYNKEIFGDYYNKNNPQLVTFFETKSALDRKRNIYRSGRNIDRKRRRTKSLGEISKQAAKEYLGGCVMFPK